MKVCCKNPKNWQDNCVYGNENGGTTVGYECEKCGENHSMEYYKYLKIMRNTYPRMNIQP